MRVISRSSHETFSNCARKGYWGYIYKGTGLSPTTTEWPLIVGLAVHKGMEVLLRSGDIEEAVRGGALTVPLDSFEAEQNQALVEGLLRGWARVRMPDFLKEWEIISIEKEVSSLLAPNVLLQGRADAVVRHRGDGSLWVINWKTTSDMKDWTAKWEDDIQAMTEALLTQEDLGEEVRGCIFEGLYKGREYKDLSSSSLITGFLHTSGEWKHEAPTGKGARTEWTKTPVWKHRPLKEWIADLPEEVVSEQFITSFPILKNDMVVREWLKQVVRKQTDIEYMLSPSVGEEDRLIYFEQNLGWRCRWCPFRPACRQEATLEGLVEEGLLKVRKDHHAPLVQMEVV